jgi:uncharacterized protein YlzI (FlbEa/FlbD family)
MNVFMVLTNASGQRVAVNPANVTSITQFPAYSSIRFVDGETLEVKDTVGEVVNIFAGVPHLNP